MKPIITLLKEFILNRVIQEERSLDYDSSLAGSLHIIGMLIEKEIDVKIGDEFVGKLVGDFLFKREINKETGQKYPICKHPNSRKSALELIEKICLNDSKYFTRVIEELKPHLIETDWRNNK